MVHVGTHSIHGTFSHICFPGQTPQEQNPLSMSGARHRFLWFQRRWFEPGTTRPVSSTNPWKRGIRSLPETNSKSTWKWMVWNFGRWKCPFGMAHFSGAALVLGKVYLFLKTVSKKWSTRWFSFTILCNLLKYRRVQVCHIVGSFRFSGHDHPASSDTKNCACDCMWAFQNLWVTGFKVFEYNNYCKFIPWSNTCCSQQVMFWNQWRFFKSQDGQRFIFECNECTKYSYIM